MLFILIVIYIIPILHAMAYPDEIQEAAEEAVEQLPFSPETQAIIFWIASALAMGLWPLTMLMDIFFGEDDG